MSGTKLDLKQALSKIRRRAVGLAAGGWPGMGDLLDTLLSDPLDPFALLPVATGRALGGKLPDLIETAAIVALSEVSLRIVDDLMDNDRRSMLHHALGTKNAVNFAIALSMVAAQEVTRLFLLSKRSPPLVEEYFSSFIDVCRGQSADFTHRPETLEAYRDIVSKKTIAAYRFAAVAGALAATADPRAVARIGLCGERLGWMAQILDDIEGLWFPEVENAWEIEKKTYPVLYAMTLGHPNTEALKNLYERGSEDRKQICAILDEMGVREQLVSDALDERDAALQILGPPFLPEGKHILDLWLNWRLRDGVRLLEAG